MLVFSVTSNLNSGNINDVQLQTWSKIRLMKCIHLMKTHQYMKPHHLFNRVFQSMLLDYFFVSKIITLFSLGSPQIKKQNILSLNRAYWLYLCHVFVQPQN